MVENSFLFGSLTKSCCGRIHESLGKLIVIFYVALTVIGGHLSAVNAGATGRTSPRSPKPDQSVRCGPYAVCDLASHYCDTVMNTCVRCSDDCHPGRINGDSLAEEDCKIKCRGRCHGFIHSFRPFLQVRYYSETPPTQHGYCAGVSRQSATDRCELRTCPRSLRGG